MKRGDKIVIIHGPHKHKTAWLNKSKKPGAVQVSIIYKSVDGDGDEQYEVTQINKTSFKMAKDVPPPGNFVEVQLLVHTTVMDSLRTAARKVARLGIADSTDAVVVFKKLVEEYMDILEQAGPKANYFPVADETGKYRTFFQKANVKNKRGHQSGNEMELSDGWKFNDDNNGSSK